MQKTSDFLTLRPATLIVGPQGSGKTTLARALAAAHGGRWVEVNATSLLDKFFLSDEYTGARRTKPTTIIVDGEIDVSRSIADKLKALTASKSIVIQRKGKPPLVTTAPSFIFCSSGAGDIELLGNSRRFNLIRLGEPSPPRTTVEPIRFPAGALGTPYEELSHKLRDWGSRLMFTGIESSRLPVEIVTKTSIRRADGSMEVREETRRFSPADEPVAALS